MRTSRTRPLAARKAALAFTLAFALSGLGAAALVSCSPSNSVESQTPGSSSSDPGASSDPGSSGAEATPTGTGTVTLPTGAIPDLASCKDLPVESVGEVPDAGTTMTNASPKGDAGVSDRLLPVDAIIKSARDRFRCCFDAGGKHARGTETKLLMVLELTPKGVLREVKFDPEKTDKVEPAITECMLTVAKGLTYAESAEGTDTVVRYPFAFRGRQ